MSFRVRRESAKALGLPPLTCSAADCLNLRTCGRKFEGEITIRGFCTVHAAARDIECREAAARGELAEIIWLPVRS